MIRTCILLFLLLVLWTYLLSQCFVKRIVSKIETSVSWPYKVRNSTVDPCSGYETRSAKEPIQ
jgi:hypothetical protein